MVSNIPFQMLDGTNTEIVLKTSLKFNSFVKAYQEIYLSIGLEHGKCVVRDISTEKDIGLTSFADIFKAELFKWMGINVAQRVITVQKTFIEQISSIINNAFGNDRTIIQIRNDIEKAVNNKDFYKWQALRIARTETTTISNYAALQAAKNSKLVLLKEWVSVQDSRTRKRPENFYDHLNMMGVTAELNEKFNISNDLLDYPGDPDAEAGDVINCRCGLSFIPKRDINGNLIKK